MFWAYVLKNNEGRTYIGHTSDLVSRVEGHHNGESYWTSRYENWELVYFESLPSRAAAMKREKEFKSGKGRDELKRKGVL
ncbi:MAG: GIY-YIG nuclease family protein [bacterium]|nr:GIY-YIG nuclease family protein [bacterium]